jgi:hypothetical protein
MPIVSYQGATICNSTYIDVTRSLGSYYKKKEKKKKPQMVSLYSINIAYYYLYSAMLYPC